MVLTISKETFDEAVQENVVEFGMSEDEAVADAIKQFEAQGINLSNILKDLKISEPGDSHIVTAALVQLGILIKSECFEATLIKEQLGIIQTECDKGLEYRILAGKNGCYNVVLDILEKYNSNFNLTEDCLKTVTALMTKQPDLLDTRGVTLIVDFLSRARESHVQRLLLKWIKECCIMHELNRQQLFEAGILSHLIVILGEANPSVIRDLLGAFRVLVLDDDVRVEFGKAHDHARAIANEALTSITELLSTFQKDDLIVCELMMTISSLLIRNEFCKTVEDAGGLDIIKNTMIAFHDKDKLIRQSFQLLKALAGNDEVKSLIIQKQLSPVIADSLNTHKGSVATAIIGLACISSLTLRSPDNSKALFEAGIPEVVVDCMKLHSNDINVQKNGSWAIRNMVSRSRYQNEKFIELGVEDILKDNLKTFAKIEYDTKSALRDLGCDVHLNEEWTGKGGMITTQSKTN